MDFFLISIIMDILKERIAKASDNGYLDLSNLKLKELPELPTDMYQIERLCLNDNNLENIDLRLFNSLIALDISDNMIDRIDFLPEKLQELACKSCKLHHITSHKNLKILHCPFNQLKELGEYPNLKDLNCEGNKINIINSYTCLEELVCSENPLTEIKNQPKLKHLDCASTQISMITNFECLETLRCAKTNVRELPYIKTLQNVAFDDLDMSFSEKYVLKTMPFKYEGEIDVLFLI